MSLQVTHNRRIQSVIIIDDDESVRRSYLDTIEDCDLDPVLESGPIPAPREYVQTILQRDVHAAVCDHHLKKHAYSAADGAELTAEFYRNRFPAILCTKWAEAQAEGIRRFRRHIPVMLNPEQLNADTIQQGLIECAREIEGHVSSKRKAWRALIRVEDLDLQDGQQRAYIVVPAWSSNVVVGLILSDLPENVRLAVTSGQAERVYAQVNLGAESESEIYFDTWELPA